MTTINPSLAALVAFACSGFAWWFMSQAEKREAYKELLRNKNAGQREAIQEGFRLQQKLVRDLAVTNSIIFTVGVIQQIQNVGLPVSFDRALAAYLVVGFAIFAMVSIWSLLLKTIFK